MRCAPPEDQVTKPTTTAGRRRIDSTLWSKQAACSQSGTSSKLVLTCAYHGAGRAAAASGVQVDAAEDAECWSRQSHHSNRHPRTRDRLAAAQTLDTRNQQVALLVHCCCSFQAAVGIQALTHPHHRVCCPSIRWHASPSFALHDTLAPSAPLGLADYSVPALAAMQVSPADRSPRQRCGRCP